MNLSENFLNALRRLGMTDMSVAQAVTLFEAAQPVTAEQPIPDDVPPGVHRALRASTRQEHLLRQAAEAADTSLTDFVLGSAVSRAERVLADRRWFVATESQYQEFLTLLDEPVPTDKLAALYPQRFEA